MTTGKKVKSFVLYTSIDTWGVQAEYIRYGMNFEIYWNTVRSLLRRLDRIQLVFMCTFNALSMPGIKRLLEGVRELKAEFGDTASGLPRVMIDLPYLREPEFLSAKILPESFGKYLDECRGYVEANMGKGGFQPLEKARIERLQGWFSNPANPSWLEQARSDFAHFIQVYDERRKLKFESVFPELAEFYLGLK